MITYKIIILIFILFGLLFRLLDPNSYPDIRNTEFEFCSSGKGLVPDTDLYRWHEKILLGFFYDFQLHDIKFDKANYYRGTSKVESAAYFSLIE
jgi:hypothetical protein